MTIYGFLKKVLRQNYSGSDNGSLTSQIEQKTFLVSRFIKYSAAGILLAFVLYALMLVFVTWPVSEWSLEKAGSFGDSFGVLTSVFTGLAFVGLMSTVFLQREELQLNRKELEQTRNELKLQSLTFNHQRFESSFYQLLSLYKENLRELSIRKAGSQSERIYGIDALDYLNKRFEAACVGRQVFSVSLSLDAQNEYFYSLFSMIQSIYYRQARYIETLANVLILVEEELDSEQRKQAYWRIVVSQLTAYEIKYIYYQALVLPEYGVLRDVIRRSDVLRHRLSTLDIRDDHKKTFEIFWSVSIPKKRRPFQSPLSTEQVRRARMSIQKREREQKTTNA